MNQPNTPQTSKLVEFHGGRFGGAVPMLLLFVTLAFLALTGYTSGKSFWAAAFLALLVGFLLIKDKSQYQQLLIDGLSDSSLAMVLLTFFISGVMSVLLTIGGLCDGLVYLAVAAHVPAQILPGCIFLLCVLVSSSTGTTSGTVAAATPVLLPLAVTLGCDPALVMGSIVSGGFFWGQPGPRQRYHHRLRHHPGNGDHHRGALPVQVFRHRRGASPWCSSWCRDSAPPRRWKTWAAWRPAACWAWCCWSARCCWW